MSSGTTIIELALKEIGAHSIVAPADSESIVTGMSVLNSMLQLWLSQAIDLGIVPLQAPGDELGEPLDARQAIIDNLAVAVSPNFDNGNNIVSPALRAAANRGYTSIENLYQIVTIPNKVVSSTLPRGAGNDRGALNNPFAGSGATIKSSDA